MAAPEDSRLHRFLDALDERTGFRALLDNAANEPVPGGRSFAYVWGSALVITFVIQALTGITLGTVYAPTVTDAWGSVWFIQHEMTLGWLVRGVHHYGSSAMIVLCVLHMTQVFFYGAYRPPREGNWILGCVMLLLVLGFGLTGYLLPWDQKGYWATQVATSIMGGAPGGEPLQQLLQGGEAYGNATLTRFYAIHVFLLPATMILFIVGHIGLFRRHGVTTRPGRDPVELERRRETFWPFQVLYDTVFGLVVLTVLVALAVTVGASLEAPADPASAYEARPEWYFLALFQLLKYFEGPLTLVGTVVLPTLAIGFLFAVPFLDRRRHGTDARRLPPARVTIPFVALFLGAGALTGIAMVSDASSEEFAQGRADADRAARLAHDLASHPAGGIDPAGRVVLYEGLKLFDDKGCASCHAKDAEEDRGPLLAGYGTEERLRAFLAAPDDARFFGGTVLEEAMEPVDLEGSALDAMVIWLLSLSGERGAPAPTPDQVQAATAAFEDGCTDCHNDPRRATTAKGYDPTAIGPDLTGYQGFEWTRGLIRDASAHAYFGGAIERDQLDRSMPRYTDLTADELQLLTRWLLAGAPGAD